jgi:PhnB protein
MTFELFFNFNGNACDAANFYAGVFKSSVENIMTYGDAPADPDFPTKPEDADKIMYATVKIADKDIMFMDMTPEFPVVNGNNITPTINITDHAEIDRLCNELAIGGQVVMAPQKTFFSNYYAMVTDKFGIIWHILTPEMP